MAVSNLIKSSLKLSFENGIHPTSGAVVLKAKSFNNVKPNADADGLFTIANALAGLQQLPLYNIERNDNSEITNA